MNFNVIQRPRRLRKTQVLRNMVRETRISSDTLVYPFFVTEGSNIKQEINTMPNQYRWSVDRLPELFEYLYKHNIKSVLIFGIPDKKDEYGSAAWNENGIVQKTLRYTKKNFPDFFCITDVCMCEYTSHGHCGILSNNYVDNDKTIEVLSKIALSHTVAGADMIAPSDMMDGRIRAIRSILDDNGFINIPIMSYSVKYSSAFYGPFRDAADSAPSFGDRKNYQMDFHNTKEALIEASLDIDEGADILMVKPGMAYLDVLNQIKNNFNKPVALYSVSGEYSMIKAAAKLGYIDEMSIIGESTVCMYRAGADILISYYAPEISDLIKNGVIG